MNNIRPSLGGNDEVKLPLITDSKNYGHEPEEEEGVIGSPDRKLYMIDDRINSLLYQSTAQKEIS